VTPRRLLAAAMRRLGEVIAPAAATEPAPAVTPLGVGLRTYREIFDHSPDLCAIVELEGNTIVDCNRTMYERLGYLRGELVGQTFYTIYHDDFRRQLESLPSPFPIAGAFDDVERRLRTRDGGSIDVSLSMRGIRDASGKPIAALAVWRDITRRKQDDADHLFLLGLGELLRASEVASEIVAEVADGLGRYLAASRCAVLEIDLATDRATIQRDYHAGVPSMAGVLPMTAFGPELVDQLADGKTVVIADAMTDDRSAAGYEVRFRPLEIRSVVAVPLMRGGRWIACVVVCTTMPRVWNVREIGLVQMVADRTWFSVERLRAQRSLRDSEEKLRQLNVDLEERVRARTSELTATLREREVLLQEVHHRVKNNLQVISSLINMQVRKLDPGATREALEECRTRVLAIALIHEKLYQTRNYAQVPFADYVRGLAVNVLDATGIEPSRVRLELAIADLPVGIDVAIPCGLVLNELITNALKHGFVDGRSGTVRIELARLDEGRLSLRVRDDGVGLPPGFDIRRIGSMGLRLVCTLADQLGAELVVDGQVGTSFQLLFRGGAT
jgi:PAS domain S-box-containing protein